MLPAALLLDCDGTIFDTEVLYLEAWRSLLLCPDSLTVEILRGRRQEEVLTILRAELRDPDRPSEEIFRQKQSLYLQLREQGVPLLPGARELVETFALHGVPIAIVSNSDRDELQYLFRQAQLDEYVRSYVGFGDAASKPAPDLWLPALEQLGVSAAASIAIEDSEHGVRSACAAGLHSFWVGGPSHVPLPPGVITVPSLDVITSFFFPSSGLQVKA
jgi:HAD superfamily hydrolase (TIGR01509 family)